MLPSYWCSKIPVRIGSIPRSIFHGMPIYETNFTWTENSENIFFTIPISGCEKKRLDIFSTDSYLKVSIPPKITEIFFKHEIISKKSVAKVASDEINFTIIKKAEGIWGCLQRENPGKQGNNDVEERRAEIEKAHTFWKEEKELNAKKKEMLKKSSINQQILMESENKKRLDSVKKAAEHETLQQIYNQKPINLLPRTNTTSIRDHCVVSVQFTEYDLTRPARESQNCLENKNPNLKADPKSDLESEIKTLKHKAAELYNCGEYLSAVDIYSKIAEKDPSIVAIFSNRASCHLHMGNFQQAINDINEAFKLMELNKDADINCRMRCYVKRGTAYWRIGQFQQGLDDYEEAFKLKPDEKLKEDVQKLRRKVHNVRDKT